MIKKLQKLLENALGDKSSELLQDQEQSKLLAAASLMIEIISVDGVQHQDEIRLLKKLLQQQFSVSADTVDSIIDQAEQSHQQATDYYSFVTEINQHFSQQEKVDLIEALWQLAWADKTIEDIEQHVIRKIAKLLHVSHKDFIATKLSVIEG